MQASLVSALQLSELGAQVFDCRFSLADRDAGRAAFEGRRIPGAHYADLERDLSGPIRADTGRHPLPTPDLWLKRMGRYGLRTDTPIVAYDDGAGVFAARFWWMLSWMGCEQVSLLDGGFHQWTKAGLPMEAGEDRRNITPTALMLDADSALQLDAGAVQNALDSDATLIVDAREAIRFSGEQEPLDRKAGCIPGSVNRHFAQNLSQGVFKSADELKSEFALLLGDRDPTEVIHSCGSGVTACHNLFAMEYAGLHGSRLYSGSWSDWIVDPARPIEVQYAG